MKIQGRKQNILFYSIRGASFKPHFLGSEEIQVIIITGIFLIFQGSPEATHPAFRENQTLRTYCRPWQPRAQESGSLLAKTPVWPGRRASVQRESWISLPCLWWALVCSVLEAGPGKASDLGKGINMCLGRTGSGVRGQVEFRMSLYRGSDKR